MLFQRTDPELHIGEVNVNCANIRADSAEVFDNQVIDIIGHIRFQIFQ